MEQSGFWNFFFATGLPQAYLAARLKEGRKWSSLHAPPERRGRDSAPSVPGMMDKKDM